MFKYMKFETGDTVIINSSDPRCNSINGMKCFVDVSSLSTGGIKGCITNICNLLFNEDEIIKDNKRVILLEKKWKCVYEF